MDNKDKYKYQRKYASSHKEQINEYYLNRRHNDPSYNEKTRLYQANYRKINRVNIINRDRRRKIPELPGDIYSGITIVKTNKIIQFII